MIYISKYYLNLKHNSYAIFSLRVPQITSAFVNQTHSGASYFSTYIFPLLSY